MSNIPKHIFAYKQYSPVFDSNAHLGDQTVVT